MTRAPTRLARAGPARSGLLRSGLARGGARLTALLAVLAIGVVVVGGGQRPLLATVIADTAFVGGRAAAQAEDGNTWLIDGAILCVPQPARALDGLRADLAARLIDIAVPRPGLDRNCPESAFRRVEVAFGSEVDGVVLDIAEGAIIEVSRAGFGPVRAYVGADPATAAPAAALGFEFDDGARTPLAADLRIVWDLPSFRAQGGDAVILPLRLREAVLGKHITSAAREPLLGGEVRMRAEHTSVGRQILVEEPLDPGDEIRFTAWRSGAAAPVSWGFLAVSAAADNSEEEHGAMNVMLHQSNAHVSVSRFGAGDYEIRPTWIGLLLVDSLALALLSGVFFLSALVTIIDAAFGWFGPRPGAQTPEE